MTLAKDILSLFLDVMLKERGYARSASQPTMYYTESYYKTLEKSDKPISTCLLDQMKNDANFPLYRNTNKIFETLKSFEPWLNWNSTVQDVTQFLEKASNLLQRTINIVDLKGGEQVVKFNSATKVQAEPYHLCFVHNSFFDVHRNQRRCWLSITCKNVQNTETTQMELDPGSSGFSRMLNFFRK